MALELSLEEATTFFSDYYGGEHHIPGQIKLFGSRGWAVNDDRGGMASYDFNQLTRLVFMAHEYCYRVELMPSSPRHIKVAIWKRQREGSMSSRHPDIQKALEDFSTGRSIKEVNAVSEINNPQSTFTDTINTISSYE